VLRDTLPTTGTFENILIQPAPGAKSDENVSLKEALQLTIDFSSQELKVDDELNTM